MKIAMKDDRFLDEGTGTPMKLSESRKKNPTLEKIKLIEKV